MKRYPGIRPFTAEDQHLFYGREEEKRDLFQMVILNEIVVLFGKSGTGKSSLLNAGVCPQFEEYNLHPVFIRLNNTNRPPNQQVYDFLRENDNIPEDMPEGLTLWEYFKRFWYVDLGELFTPVIIFDQFEELFTLYTFEERESFIDQLADMVNGRIPDSLRQKMKSSANTLDGSVDWQTPPKVKFLIAIRSDYLYLLNELSRDIPSILRSRFELGMLNRSYAIQAITLPAIADGAFDSPTFQYEKKALNEIIDVLGQRESDQLRNDLPESELEIEAFQLQLFCQQIENRIIAENKPIGFKVNSDFFGGKAGIQTIIEAFYSDVINRLPKEHQLSIESMISTFLIRNNRRIIMEESAIKEEYNIPQKILDQLREERLLRKEARTGSFYYEISHDTLIAPILTSKKRRIELERKEKIKKDQEERKIELEQIKQKRNRARNISIIMTFLTLLSLIFLSLALYKSDQATKAGNEAKKLEEEAIAKNEMLLEVNKKLNREIGERILITANEFFRYEEYEDALFEYKSALRLIPEDDEIQKMIRECEKRIQQKINEQ